jgi:ankyrin repeat protein
MKKILLLTALTFASHAFAFDANNLYSPSTVTLTHMGETFRVNKTEAIINLHSLCKEDCITLAKRYSQSGILNITDHNGFAPLHFACAYGSVNVALWLLDQPSVMVNATTKRGATPLDMVLECITELQAGRSVYNDDMTKYQAIETALRAKGAKTIDELRSSRSTA